MKINMLYKFIIIILIALTGFGIPQADAQLSFGQYYEAGQNALDKQNYSAALSYFGKAHEMDENDLDALYQLAEASRLQYAYRQAASKYETVINLDENVQYPKASYQLGMLKNNMAEYDEAIRYLDLYLSEYDDLDPIITAKALKTRASATWAKDQMNTVSDDNLIQIEALSGNTNTGYSEHAPVWKDSKLEYSSLRFPSGKKGKVIVSKILTDDEVLSTPNNSLFNSDNYLTSNVAYTQDGKTQFFTICEYGDQSNRINCDIYYRSKMSDDNWSLEKKLPQIVNAPYSTTTHVNVGESNDGMTTLYFVSDREDGLGGLDIWSTQFDNSYNFQQPINESKVNSKGDDITPYFDHNKGVLYFSTDSRLGFGGFDVFAYANTKIENLGRDINSSFNDIYYSLADEESAYFSSNRIGSKYLSDKYETCCYDIYKANLKPCVVDLIALTFDEKTRKPLDQVTITVSDESGQLYNFNSNEYNRFNYIIPCKDDLTISISKDGYDPKTIAITSDGADLSRDIYLTPIPEPLPELVSLTVNTLERATKSPLLKVQLQIKDSFGKIIETNFSDIYGKTSIAVRPGEEYVITAMKEGYEVELDRFTIDRNPRSNLKRDIYLGRIAEIASLNNLIPLKLYFDNDRPNRRTMQTTTEKSYSETFTPYYAQKGKYQNVFSEQFVGERKTIAESDVYSFFEQDLRKGYETLSIFMETLHRILQSGQKVNLYLRGYASPLSQSAYNEALGNRRVNSVENEFKQYNQGVLKQYIRSGQLIITERSFGELQSSTRVSDDFTNPALSIFSPDACKERRIEIDEIKPIN